MTTSSVRMPISYRYSYCLLLILTSYYHTYFCITVVDHPRQSNEQGTEGEDTADDTRSEKVEDEDAENKHFMDVYSLQSGPKQWEFGHVFEDPNVWEQRYEKKDFDGQRYQGKVKWGDKDGGYGEQYWDLNHGGAGESAQNNEENEQYEETTPAEYVQETRRRPIMYNPMMAKLMKKNKNIMSRKPAVQNVRKPNPKRPFVEPSVAPSNAGSVVDKKSAPVLVFDMKTGVVMDEATGNRFVLKPIND